MRRKAAIICAGIEPKRFDTLCNRGQMPFQFSGRGWADYSLDDVFRLRLMLDLTDYQGIDLGRAASIAFQAIDIHWIDRHPLEKTVGDVPDIWAVDVAFTAHAGDSVNHQILACYEREVQDFALADTLLKSPNAEIVRVVSINASASARHVLRQAESLGILDAEYEKPLWAKDFSKYAHTLCYRRDAIRAVKILNEEAD